MKRGRRSRAAPKQLELQPGPVPFRPIGRKLVGELLRASARLEVSRNALLGGFEMSGPRLRLMKMVRRRCTEPRTVSQLARAIGVSRQTLQETVKDLVAAGLVNLESNTFHRRAPIVVLSAAGDACLDRLLLVEQRWIADLTRGFDEQLLAQTEWVVRCLRERLSD